MRQSGFCRCGGAGTEKSMIKRLLLLVFCVIFASCAVINRVVEPPKPEPLSVDVSTVKNGNIMVMNIKVSKPDWEYMAGLSKDGRKAVVILRNNTFKLNSQELTRPISKMDVTEAENVLKLEIYLGNRNKMTEKAEGDSLQLTFRALEPDMEEVAMELFGKWTDPLLSASRLLGIDNGSDVSVIKMNSTPAYGAGTAGNKNYLDIYGVRIPEGNLKHDSLSAVNSVKGKTRLIFKNGAKFCPDKFNMVIGRQCGGYNSLLSLKKEINGTNESFEFILTGRPQVMEKRQKGMTAFGMKNVKVFGEGVRRYEDEQVYKVETRKKDGIIWLVFLHEPELRSKTYFSGDNFFVVFYR